MKKIVKRTQVPRLSFPLAEEAVALMEGARRG